MGEPQSRCGTGQQQLSGVEVSWGGKGDTAPASMGAALTFQKLGGPVPALGGRCWFPVPPEQGIYLTPEVAFCYPHWIRESGGSWVPPTAVGTLWA